MIYKTEIELDRLLRELAKNKRILVDNAVKLFRSKDHYYAAREILFKDSLINIGLNYIDISPTGKIFIKSNSYLRKAIFKHIKMLFAVAVTLATLYFSYKSYEYAKPKKDPHIESKTRF